MYQDDYEAILNAMKYKEIQAECKKYGLMAGGTRMVLKERLLTHLMEQRSEESADNNREEERADKQTEPMEVERQPEPLNSTPGDDLKMNDVDDDDAVHDKKQPSPKPVPLEKAVVVLPVRVSSSSIQSQVDDPMSELSHDDSDHRIENEPPKDPPGKSVPGIKKPEEVVALPTAIKSPIKSPIKSSAVKSPMKSSAVKSPFKGQSPMKGIVQSAMKSITLSAQKLREHPSDSIPEDDDISPPPSDFTSSTTSSRVRDIVSKFSNSNPTNSALSNPNSTNSALSKCVQAKKEARMARMAEMREKVCIAHLCLECIYNLQDLTTTTRFSCSLNRPRCFLHPSLVLLQRRQRRLVRRKILPLK